MAPETPERDTTVHANLEALERAIERLDPSPSEMLWLMNHVVGAAAAYVDVVTWRGMVARAADDTAETRSSRP